jgi:hypothetical protein
VLRDVATVIRAECSFSLRMPIELGRLVEALWHNLNERDGVGTEDALGADGGPLDVLAIDLGPVLDKDVEKAPGVHLASNLSRGFVRTHVKSDSPAVWGRRHEIPPSSARKP